MRVNERNLIIAASAAGTILGASKTGILGNVPTVDGLNPAYLILAGGLFLSVVWGKEGTIGAVGEGAGYGLVALGVLALTSN